MWRPRKINYMKELIETKQIRNAINQLRDASEKRWFEIIYNATKDWFNIDFKVDEDKAKLYYKEKDKKIKEFNDRKEKYKSTIKKKKIKLVRRW